MTARCRQAIADKHSAFGTNKFHEKRFLCSQTLREEFLTYVTSIKQRLSSLKRGSKLFWKISKKLLMGSDRSTSVPTLREDVVVEGVSSTTWARQPQQKADLFARTFQAKWTLPPADTNFYSFQATTSFSALGGMLQLRSRNAKHYFETLDAASATGPDYLPTMLLRCLAAVLCVPFCRLARRIVETGKWPRLWKKHWIFFVFTSVFLVFFRRTTVDYKSPRS